MTALQDKIFLDRYALRDEQGKHIEDSPEQMWRRVADAIAEVEFDNSHAGVAVEDHYAEKFYEILKDYKFVPGGRILSGAGTGAAVSAYNCFVLPQPEDSRHGILESLGQMTEIMARGGGVGINFSSLRPKGSYIKTVNGTSSGPVTWMELFSTMTGKVIQQGGSRRGALMLMLDDDHPDIMEFIQAKDIDPATNRPRLLEHANVSIAVSDQFMEAVKNDDVWQTTWPTKAAYAAAVAADNYSLVREYDSVHVYGHEYRARDLWDAICTHAHATAEPGLVFIDRYNTQSNTWYYENIRATNPCGEQGLPEWGVCNLGAMNLSAYVQKVSYQDDRGWFNEFDYVALDRDVRTAIRFLDNVIDYTPYHFKENQEAQKDTRRTGLGTMGLADAMIKLELRYGSDEALEFIDDVYGTIREAAYAASVELAKEKGPFRKFDKDKYLQGPFIKELPTVIQNNIAKHGIRNAVILTQAPTGTTSMLAGVSSGIEPVFSFKMKRVDRTGESLIYHPLAEKYLQENPGQELPEYFVESGDLTPQDHVRVQAAIQKHTDSSISKTVNGPNSDTVEQVKELYLSAYDQGCKGITYYRDGSRDAVLTKIDTLSPDTVVEAIEEMLPFSRQNIRRPNVLSGKTYEIQAPGGNTFVTVNNDVDGPRELFVTVGRAGSDVAALAEAIGRLSSLVLNVDPFDTKEQRLEKIRHQLNGIGGSTSVGFGKKRIASLPDAVAKVLDQHLYSDIQEQEETPTPVETAQRGSGTYCPECGNEMVNAEGCKVCLSCGHSLC